MSYQVIDLLSGREGGTELYKYVYILNYKIDGYTVQTIFMILALSSLVYGTQRARNELIKDKGSKRDQKLFSLFSVVTFKNSGCQSSSGTTGSGINRNGKHL